MLFGITVVIDTNKQQTVGIFNHLSGILLAVNLTLSETAKQSYPFLHLTRMKAFV